MSGPLILLSYSLKRTRTLVLTMGLVLGAFQILLVAVAASIQRSGAFNQLAALMPPFVRELMGPAIAAFLSFGGIVCVGYFHLVVMSALIGLSIALATVPASEVETGFVDLLLSRPLARHWIISRSIVVVVLCNVLVIAAMVAGTWIGLSALAPPGSVWPSGRLIGSLAANLLLLMLCWSGVAMAMASRARRRAAAGAGAAVLALVSFLVDYLGRMWKPAETIGKLSPFRYFSPFDLVLGGKLPLRNVVVLAAIAICGFAIAQILYSRRDLTR